MNERRDLPIAQQPVGPPVGAFQRAGRHERRVEVVAGVKDAGTPVGMAIERLRVPRSGQSGAKIGVGNTVGVRVVGEEGKVVCELMLHRQE